MIIVSENQPSKTSRILVVEFDLTKAIGAVPNDLCYVVEVLAGGAADGKIGIGDKIEKVNDDTVINRHHFMELIEMLRSCEEKTARLTIIRNADTQKEIKEQLKIINERRAHVIMRHGCQYLIMNVTRTKDKRLGLFLKDFSNRVIVSRIAENSFCAGELRQYDQICDIDHHPVTNRHVAKTMIQEHFAKNRSISMLIARPYNEYALEWTKWALQQHSRIPPSIRMNVDVSEIVEKEIKEMQSGNKPQPQSAFKKDGVTYPQRTATIDKNTKFVPIASDYDPSTLQPLPTPSTMSQSWRPGTENCD